MRPSAVPGLYVHVPFCRTRCIYCDFSSTTRTDLAARWFTSLEREIQLYKDGFSHFDSLYIGGGTPSLLDTARMASLFDVLRSRFTFTPDAEITMEANPDDIDAARLGIMKSLGVNRLSFGVQSFDDGELAFLKRRHTAPGARKAIEEAFATGFSNIGIDLMYGLPGQTKEGWLSTLKQALSFHPRHLSCYQLTVEGRTPLGKMIDRGNVSLPDEDESSRFFLLTSRFLESHGFIHYEVSNFAVSREFFCRHNQKYWRHVPYLGLGPAAHSFDGSRRWWNHRSVERYCDAIEAGVRPVAGEETLSPEQLELERMYLGLRTRQGITLQDLPESALPIVEELKRSRLIRITGNRLRPSRRGYLVADSLPVLLSR